MTAFSNGFEYDTWAERHCWKCRRDDGESVFCPILDLALLENIVPPQWSEGSDDLRNRYVCSEFEAG